MFQIVYLSSENDLVHIGLSCALILKIVLKNGKIATLVILTLSSESLPNFVIKVLIFSIAIKNRESQKQNKTPAGKT